MAWGAPTNGTSCTAPFLDEHPKRDFGSGYTPNACSYLRLPILLSFLPSNFTSIANYSCNAATGGTLRGGCFGTTRGATGAAPKGGFR